MSISDLLTAAGVSASSPRRDPKWTPGLGEPGSGRPVPSRPQCRPCATWPPIVLSRACSAWPSRLRRNGGLPRVLFPVVDRCVPRVSAGREQRRRRGVVCAGPSPYHARRERLHRGRFPGGAALRADARRLGGALAGMATPPALPWERGPPTTPSVGPPRSSGSEGGVEHDRFRSERLM